MKVFHAVCVKAENNVNVTSPHWWLTPPAPGHIHFEDKAATDPYQHPQATQHTFLNLLHAHPDTSTAAPIKHSV